MRRMTFLVILVAFISSCGGQWYVLQGLAWIEMIRDYSQTVPLSQAVEMTLSGQYPCNVCKALAEKKQSDNSALLSAERDKKKQCTSFFAMARPSPNVTSVDFVVHPSFLQTHSEAPPTPPPRLS